MLAHAMMATLILSIYFACRLYRKHRMPSSPDTQPHGANNCRALYLLWCWAGTPLPHGGLDGLWGGVVLWIIRIPLSPRWSICTPWSPPGHPRPATASDTRAQVLLWTVMQVVQSVEFNHIMSFPMVALPFAQNGHYPKQTSISNHLYQDREGRPVAISGRVLFCFL